MRRKCADAPPTYAIKRLGAARSNIFRDNRLGVPWSLLAKQRNELRIYTNAIFAFNDSRNLEWDWGVCRISIDEDFEKKSITFTQMKNMKDSRDPGLATLMTAEMKKIRPKFSAIIYHIAEMQQLHTPDNSKAKRLMTSMFDNYMFATPF